MSQVSRRREREKLKYKSRGLNSCREKVQVVLEENKVEHQPRFSGVWVVGSNGYWWQVSWHPASRLRRVDGVSSPWEYSQHFPCFTVVTPPLCKGRSLCEHCLRPQSSCFFCIPFPMPLSTSHRTLQRCKETNQTQLPIPGKFVQTGSKIGFCIPFMSIGLPW